MEKEKNQCKAWSKRHKRQCKKPPMKGREVCRMHGGKSPRGFASATLKTGRYSKDLLTQAMSDYQANRVDPSLFHLDEEVALSTAMLQETLRTTQLPAYWAELSEQHEKVCQLYVDGLVFLGEEPSNAELQDLLSRPEGGELGRALVDMSEALRDGADRYTLDERTVERAIRIMEGKRRLVDSEMRRFDEAGALWSLAQVKMYVGRILVAVGKRVDRATLAQISADIQSGGSRSGPVGGGRAAGQPALAGPVAPAPDGSDTVDPE